MNWIFYTFIAAGVLHVLEEYFYPGGFPDFMKKMSPSFAPFVTTGFAIVINGLFLVLCILAAVVGRNNLVFSLSVASLLISNGMIHLMDSLRARRYAPGLITGLLLYIPLGTMAYIFFWGSGELSIMQGILSILFGLAYQVVPVGYLGLASLLKVRA
jgi:hypothetical protein